MDNEELARRAVAADGWRWMGGMLALAAPPAVGMRIGDMMLPVEEVDDETLPDLADPATLGCLLALVREKHGDYITTAFYDMGGDDDFWVTEYSTGKPLGDWAPSTEAEVLVLALEASP